MTIQEYMTQFQGSDHQLMINLQNNPDRLLEFSKAAFEDQKLRKDNHNLIGKVVENLMSDHLENHTANSDPLHEKAREVKEALSKLNSKFLEDEMDKIDDIDELILFLKKKGNKIKRLDLTNFQSDIGDEHIKNFTQLCPNLSFLLINSMKITDQALKEISSLKALTTLKLFYFNQLKSFDLSSETLTELHLYDCAQLESVNISSLTTLKTLHLDECKKLQSINGLSSSKTLTKLKVYYSEELTSINLTSSAPLTTLELERCEQLKSVNGLSSLTALKILNIVWCEELHSVGDVSSFINLTELSFEACDQLKSVGHLSSMTHLTELSLGGCRELEPVGDLSSLTELTTLDLSGYPHLQSVGNLNSFTKLTTLLLRNHQDLESIDLSSLTELTHLDLSDNIKLKTLELSSLKSIETLRLIYCEELESIDLSSLTELTTLDLQGCKKLQSLEGLSALTKLLDLDISSCTALTTANVSTLPVLNDFKCKDCFALTSVGEALPNSCRLFDCTNCYILVPPQTPPGITLSSRSQFHSFPVDPDQLDKEPISVLLELGQRLLANRPMPNIVWLDSRTKQPDKGIDAGGIRRQLITTLCENLFKDGSGFTFVKDLKGKKNPTVDHDKTPNSILSLRTFARLIAVCATQSPLMGDHLSEHFYRGVAALSDDELDSISLDQPIPRNLQEKIYKKTWGLDANEKELADESLVLLSLFIIAKELKEIPGTLNSLRRNPELFIDRVQGRPLTKKSFSRALIIDNRLTKSYFSDYIEEKSEEKLKDLLELLTSSRTLGKNSIRITVFPNRDLSNSPIVFHTCAYEAEMPLYQNYSQFKLAIEPGSSDKKQFKSY